MYINCKNLIFIGVLQHTFYKMHSSGTESNELNITLDHHNHLYQPSQPPTSGHHQINPPSASFVGQPTGATSFGDFHDSHRQHFVHPGMLHQPPGNNSLCVVGARGWWKALAHPVLCCVGKIVHILHPGVDMLTFRLTVVSADCRPLLLMDATSQEFMSLVTSENLALGRFSDNYLC